MGNSAAECPVIPVAPASGRWEGVDLLQQCINGLSFGALIALIALGYTMVYGIIGLINFAHGDLFMLGSFLGWAIVGRLGRLGWLHLEDLNAEGSPRDATWKIVAAIGLMLIVVPLFCAALNWTIDRLVYKPLRKAPKLAPLVSAIGVSFIFMNIGQRWGGASDINFPKLVSDANLLGDSALRFTPKDVLLLAVVLPIMIGLTVLVKWTSLGRAMRATAQNPVAAQLMGINVDRVIGATFLIGGALGGVASVIFSLYTNTINFQMGYQNGLYAFTAAVLGGIGNIPGAVLGGLVIGFVHDVGGGAVGEHWADALIFGILILILVFRPSGLLGERTREKV